jgi:invasion protein IalB
MTGGLAFDRIYRKLPMVLLMTLTSTFTGHVRAQSAAQKFGAWALRCDGASSPGAQQCGLMQNVSSEESPNVNVVIVIRKSPALKNGVFQVIAPSGVLLPEGVKVKIDQSDIGQIPFIKCFPFGCIAEGAVDDSLIEKLKGGRIGVVTIYMSPGEGLRHLFKLDGFSDGYNAIH